MWQWLSNFFYLNLNMDQQNTENKHHCLWYYFPHKKNLTNFWASWKTKSPTWSFRSSFWKPGTAFANSVSSVTVSTDVLWQQRNSRASASLCWSSMHTTWQFSGLARSPFATWTAKVLSASWNVSMSWIMKGCWEGRKEVKDGGGGGLVHTFHYTSKNSFFRAVTCLYYW